MGGFSTQSLNLEFKQSLYELIVTALVKCSDLMKKDCLANNTKVANHEEKIRNHLLENYLENDNVRLMIGLSGIAIRFMPETPENYAPSTDTYIGRADIKVVSINFFSNNKDYYIIEFKRIDGSNVLNEKYINEGICRFVIDPLKYSSYHHKNIMFGFVVKNIDFILNVSEIAKLHEDKLNDITITNITVLEREEKQDYCLCESYYNVRDNVLQLSHIFYNFSSIIKIKS